VKREQEEIKEELRLCNKESIAVFTIIFRLICDFHIKVAINMNWYLQ